MKVKLVYGCPCSGKSTYVSEHATDEDLIYDYDALLSATTTQKEHLVARHKAHFIILGLRQSLVDLTSQENSIETLWMQCRWPTEKLKEILQGFEVEDIFIQATKDECYERLDADDSRPDKDEWRAIIDAWFDEHGEPAGKEDKYQMSKFWKYLNRTFTNDAGESQQVSVLRIDGPIDSELWWGDEVTPDAFRAELEAHPGDIEVYINSPGGDVIAASQIYTMLVEHKGNVVVKIEGLAASAASIIAMAGTTVLMAPVAYMMIHGASTIAWGNHNDMRHEADVLEEIDKGIRDAYCLKTGLRESKVAQLMEDETWMSAKTCIALGFADGYIGKDAPEPETEPDEEPDEDEPADVKRETGMVAWAGRHRFAAMLKGMENIASLDDLIALMKAHKGNSVGTEPEPEATTEADPEPAPEGDIEPVIEHADEPTTDPEPENTVVDVKQFYDRLKTIKDKF